MPRALANWGVRGAVEVVADADTGRVVGVHALAEGPGEMMLVATYASRRASPLTRSPTPGRSTSPWPRACASPPACSATGCRRPAVPDSGRGGADGRPRNRSERWAVATLAAVVVAGSLLLLAAAGVALAARLRRRTTPGREMAGDAASGARRPVRRPSHARDPSDDVRTIRGFLRSAGDSRYLVALLAALAATGYARPVARSVCSGKAG